MYLIETRWTFVNNQQKTNKYDKTLKSKTNPFNFHAKNYLVLHTFSHYKLFCRIRFRYREFRNKKIGAEFFSSNVRPLFICLAIEPFFFCLSCLILTSSTGHQLHSHVIKPSFQILIIIAQCSFQWSRVFDSFWVSVSLTYHSLLIATQRMRCFIYFFLWLKAKFIKVVRCLASAYFCRDKGKIELCLWKWNFFFGDDAGLWDTCTQLWRSYTTTII